MSAYTCRASGCGASVNVGQEFCSRECAAPPSPPKEPMSDEPSEGDFALMVLMHDSGIRAVYRAGRASRNAEVAELKVELTAATEQLEVCRTELARLRADSMRGAVEMLRDGDNVNDIVDAIDKRLDEPEVKRRIDYAQGDWFTVTHQEALAVVADWLESQAPKADPDRARRNKHIGQSLDDFLRETGELDEVNAMVAELHAAEKASKP